MLSMVSNLMMGHTNENQDNHLKKTTEGFRNLPKQNMINKPETSFINSPETPKNINIKNNKYYNNMKQEIKKAKRNIECINNNKDKSLIKYDKPFETALIDLFTKNTFMIQQIIKMETISGKNEQDLQNATDDFKKLNNLCENIYGFSNRQ